MSIDQVRQETESVAVELPEWASLPSVSLAQRGLLPRFAGVYFVVTGDRLLYVGRSQDMFNRWGNHHRQAEMEAIEGVRIHHLVVDDYEALPDIERAYIVALKPAMNKVQYTVKNAVSPIGREPLDPDDKMESFNTRLPKSLQRRLKMYCAAEGMNIQEVIRTALEVYLRGQ